LRDENSAINKLIANYKTRYGSRPEFPDFEKNIKDQIGINEKSMAGIKDGTGKLTLTGITRDPVLMAQGVIDIASAKANLLAPSERIADMIADVDKEM